MATSHWFKILIRYITSDCDAVAIIHNDQGYAKSPEDAVVDVLKAGMWDLSPCNVILCIVAAACACVSTYFFLCIFTFCLFAVALFIVITQLLYLLGFWILDSGPL